MLRTTKRNRRGGPIEVIKLISHDFHVHIKVAMYDERFFDDMFSIIQFVAANTERPQQCLQTQRLV